MQQRFFLFLVMILNMFTFTQTLLTMACTASCPWSLTRRLDWLRMERQRQCPPPSCGCKRNYTELATHQDQTRLTQHSFLVCLFVFPKLIPFWLNLNPSNYYLKYQDWLSDSWLQLVYPFNSMLETKGRLPIQSMNVGTIIHQISKRKIENLYQVLNISN